MKKARNTTYEDKKMQLNRIELLLMGYFGEYWMLPFIEDGYGAYNVQDHRFISYKRSLSDQEIQHIIRCEVKKNFSNLSYEKPTTIANVKSELIATYFFLQVDEFREHNLLLPLSVPQEHRADLWSVWGVLDDGTILNPLQTEPMLDTFSGNQTQTILSNRNRRFLNDAPSS